MDLRCAASHQIIIGTTSSLRPQRSRRLSLPEKPFYLSPSAFPSCVNLRLSTASRTGTRRWSSESVLRLALRTVRFDLHRRERNAINQYLLDPASQHFPTHLPCSPIQKLAVK